MTVPCTSTTGKTPFESALAMEAPNDQPAPFSDRPPGYERIGRFDPLRGDVSASWEPGSARMRRGDTIVIVYDKLFLAECLRSVLQAALGAQVQILTSLDQMRDEEPPPGRMRLILFLFDAPKPPETCELVRRAAATNAAVVVLSHVREQRLVRDVMHCGARAYIPMATGTAVAIEAVRFVLAGGTYFPPETLMGVASGPVDPQESETNPITLRELSIIQAIQKGKSNKIIAYELKLCESTVKVHIRNIMRKFKAKNRTEVAVRSAELAAAPEFGGPA